MLKTAPTKTKEAAELSLHLLDELFGKHTGDSIGVRLWDGARWPDDRQRAVTLVLNHPSALRSMLQPGTELALAEAYLFNDIDIEGDIIQLFDLVDGVVEATSGWTKKIRVARELLRLPPGPEHPASRRGPAHLSGKLHSIERDRQAVRFHYDVSNDFYSLWLDSRMVYSCAYFETPETDLDTAQLRKLDQICRKLRLKPGMRLLDVGCGWGGLILYAAQRYGVDATGITLSQPQADLANERIRAAALQDRCRAEVRDYREMSEDQPFDALVSVGMFEHVGGVMLPSYFAKAMRLLKPGCVFLNHGIASRAGDVVSPNNFDDAYVFPDSDLLPISQTLTAAEDAGFEVRDLESLREHYALTLQHWTQRIEAHHLEELKHVDEPTYRVWRLYMAGSSHGFTHRRLNVYQTLLVKVDAQDRSGLPLTRADWYR
jgi:cyclopropane-fatty-acyl-phospholipid synthase